MPLIEDMRSSQETPKKEGRKKKVASHEWQLKFHEDLDFFLNWAQGGAERNVKALTETVFVLAVGCIRTQKKAHWKLNRRAGRWQRYKKKLVSFSYHREEGKATVTNGHLMLLQNAERSKQKNISSLHPRPFRYTNAASYGESSGVLTARGKRWKRT